MNAMTLEQVRDWHRHQLNFLPESGVPTDLHQNAADAIDSHLAQTAKAVDVVVLRARMNGKAWQYYAPDYLSSEAISKLAGYGWEFERLTRAISGGKAGPVDGWKLVPVEPTPAMRAAFRADPEALTHFTHTTLQCADFDSRYRAMLGAASPAPDKECQP